MAVVACCDHEQCFPFPKSMKHNFSFTKSGWPGIDEEQAEKEGSNICMTKFITVKTSVGLSIAGLQVSR